MHLQTQVKYKIWFSTARRTAYFLGMGMGMEWYLSMQKCRPHAARRDTSSTMAYGQVRAQLFPHTRAFDGMPARAPANLLTWNKHS